MTLNNLSEISRLEYFSNMYTSLGMEAFDQTQYKRAFVFLLEALNKIEEMKLQLSENSEQRFAVQELEATKADIHKKVFHILKTFGDESWDNQDYVTAIVYFEEALKLNSNDANLCNTIAFMYKNVGYKHQNLDKQIYYLEKAVELDPNHLQAIRSLAVTYPLADRNQEAVEYFHKLFELGAVPDDYMAYSQLKIQLGDFKEGWKHYDSRFSIAYNPHEYPEIDKPKWEGQVISDKTLLVHYEFGFGDSIQFSRYIEQAKPLAKKIIFVVQDSLVDLFKNNLKDIEVVGFSTQLEELSFDYYIMLMSMPYVLNATVENIPSSVPYFIADEKKIQEYKDKFFDNDCFKIGISYNGSKFGNAFRDMLLKDFYPLTKIKNVKIYSFQKGFGSDQLYDLPEGIEIIDLGQTFDDFSDTAAAMANVDLFVGSDNGVFHVAAAMGKKTFLLLSKYSEWRWFYDEETTPWYDSVKIFKKQSEDESWDLQIQRVVEVLTKQL